jgi:hypothetical protein
MNEVSGRRPTMKKEGRTAMCYVWLNQGQTIRVRAGRGVRQGCCLPLFEFSMYREYLTKALGTSK